VIGALEQGASKGGLDDYVIIAISSEGTVRNGAGDTVKLELADILKGDFVAPHISIFHYKLDDIKEVGKPEKWVKAQPNLDFTVTYETYQQDVERMEAAPASKNDILAKRFGIPAEGYTYFFTYDETRPIERPLDFRGLLCAMGADLSQGDDFCAFTFLFPLRDGAFGIKTRSYITRLTFDQLPAAARLKYDQFMQEGSLIVMDTAVLDMLDVYDDLDAHIEEMEYTVQALGYDPYNAKEFVNRWEQENGAWNIEKVIQGARTESVPLGELKKLSEAEMLLFDELLMSWAMGNAVTLEDTNGNRKLLKRRHEEKIDNVAALLDAWVAYKLHKEDFE
jgi:phage terminase large subunit-like protein